MKNRFKKVLSMLIIIAMLASSIMMVFAEEENVPAVEGQIVETAGVEEASNEAEAPTQEEASIQEAAPAQEEAAIEEAAPAQEEATIEEAAPIQEEATIEEAAPIQEEATIEEAAPTQAEAVAEEPTPAVENNTVEETPAEKAEETSEVKEEASKEAEAPAEDVIPAEKVEAEIPSEGTDIINEETVSEDEEEFIDELANDTTEYSEEDTQELGDDAGYIDPEVIEEHIPEVTAEMKYENITELKIGEKVKGKATTEESGVYIIKPAQSRHIVLGMTTEANVKVIINDKEVRFVADETVENFSSYEMNAKAGTTYIIEIVADNASFILSAEYKAETQEEEITETEETEVIEESETFEETEVTEEIEAEAVEATEETKVEETEAEETENTEATEEQSATPAAEDEAAKVEEEIIETEEVVPAEDIEDINNVETLTEEKEKTESTEAAEEQSATPAAEDEAAKVEEEIIETEEVVPAEDIEDINNVETLTEEKEKTESTEAAEEQSTTPAAEDEAAKVEEEIIETEEVVPAEDNNNEETLTEENEETETLEHSNTKTLESEEETIPAITAWIETETEEYTIGDQITLNANANTELSDAIAWQISVDGEEWNKIEAPYSKTLVIDVTEENINSFYRFKIADGIFSEVFQLADTEKVEEQTEDENIIDDTEAIPEKEKEQVTEETEKKENSDKEENEPEEIELTDEEMIELGYYKVQVIMKDGAGIFGNIEENAEETEPIGHLDHAAEIWVKLTEDNIWAEICGADGNAIQKFIEWDNVIITKQKDRETTTEEEQAEPTEEENDNIEEKEELLVRSLKVTSTLTGKDCVAYNEEIVLQVELINFKEDDTYTCQWQYSRDGVEYLNAEDANDLTYSYRINDDTIRYKWRVLITIENKD